jgi:hypothetical protein
MHVKGVQLGIRQLQEHDANPDPPKTGQKEQHPLVYGRLDFVYISCHEFMCFLHDILRISFQISTLIHTSIETKVQLGVRLN